MMRRHRLSPALPALFAILAGCGDAPSTIAPDHVFDAGGVSADRAELSHVFVVENPSEADWNVDRVVPTCHCVRTAQGPLSIPAHGSARVPVSIDLRSLAGTVEYSVRLFSGDFPRGHLDLTLRAQLDRRALVSPRELVLPESGPGEVVNGRCSSARRSTSNASYWAPCRRAPPARSTAAERKWRADTSFASRS